MELCIADLEGPDPGVRGWLPFLGNLRPKRAVRQDLGHEIIDGEAEGIHEVVFPLGGVMAVGGRAMALGDAQLAAAFWRIILRESGPHASADQQRARRRPLQESATRDSAACDEL